MSFLGVNGKHKKQHKKHLEKIRIKADRNFAVPLSSYIWQLASSPWRQWRLGARIIQAYEGDGGAENMAFGSVSHSDVKYIYAVRDRSCAGADMGNSETQDAAILDALSKNYPIHSNSHQCASGEIH